MNKKPDEEILENQSQNLENEDAVQQDMDMIQNEAMMQDQMKSGNQVMGADAYADDEMDLNDEEEMDLDDEEEMDLDDEEEDEAKEKELKAALERLYEKRRYRMLSKKDAKKEYKEDGKRAVGAKAAGIKSRKQQIADEAQELMAAAQSVPPTILSGEIYGFGYEDEIPMVYVQREGKEFKFKIPIQMLMPIKLENYTGEEGKRKLDRELRSRVGSKIDFIVYNVDESNKNHMAYASRIKAMEIRSRQYFVPVKGRKKARYEVGGKAVARVVAVKNNSIKVEMMGAECTMKSEDLSWKAMYELTNEFTVGDEFEVKILSVEEKKYTALGQTYTLYAVKASKRELEPNPATLYFDKFMEGSTYSGVIKAHTEAGVFVELAGMMDCLCPPPAVGRPIRGKKCLIQITEKDEKKKFIYGRFV